MLKKKTLVYRLLKEDLIVVYSHYVLFRGASSTVQSRPEVNSQYGIKKKNTWGEQLSGRAAP